MKPLLLAALTLPYTLNLSGQGQFQSAVGMPACVAASRDDLLRQRAIVERTCARDGGALVEGRVVDTLVQGVLCTSVQPFTCDTPRRAAARRKAPPPSAEPESPRA